MYNNKKLSFELSKILNEDLKREQEIEEFHRLKEKYESRKNSSNDQTGNMRSH